ncbi:MAG: hypothetical protein IGS49_21005 [Chlorogloeopsis fritschii C42_A2020_084]|uniref:hypothetical protein n=1 Tax=Chlorogloeopsis fritschii TaxID=1124 RepID=UPI0019F0B50D|nr:hypothetical protein [Chlorogloeopsis fritschii]MBF2007857.1 hypothetical protein [Chlorogloeopsis fritschii C42_A2020_084]
MAKQSNFLTFLATVFLLTITGQSATAFTINFPSGENQRAFQDYRTSEYYGYTWVTVPEQVERNSSEQAELLSLLNSFGQGTEGNINWQFEFAQNDLNGSFDFKSYFACGFYDQCGNRVGYTDVNEGGVGAEIDLEYHPVGNDPQLSILSSLYWIQRVSSNHPINPDVHAMM